MGVRMPFDTNTPLSPQFWGFAFWRAGEKTSRPHQNPPPFPLSTKKPKKLFSLPHFPSPPIITPTKCNVKDVQKKNWSITKCHPYPTNLALTYTSFNLYGLKYTFSCSTLTCQKFSYDKQNKVISRSFNMTKHTTSDKSQ